MTELTIRELIQLLRKNAKPDDATALIVMQALAVIDRRLAALEAGAHK